MQCRRQGRSHPRGAFSQALHRRRESLGARRSVVGHAPRRTGARGHGNHRLRRALHARAAADTAAARAPGGHMTQELRLRRPDDWHLHLRDGAALRAVLPFSAARFARAIVMPNLTPALSTTAAALAYRERILAALPAGAQFQPLMTLYLTDGTPVDEIARARAAGLLGCKLYPAGATTHAEAGVTDVRKIGAVLERMSECGLVLQVHGEVTDPSVDVFEREARFIESVLAPLIERHAQLRVVVEHISTKSALQFVLSARQGVAATVTPQHLLMNRNALFAGGLRPHHYCL